MNALTVDRINLLLLVFAFAVAYIIPFELLLLSYAFLGPLHYLTEISWLHDRKYFTIRREDPWLLTIGSFILLFMGAAIFPSSSELVWMLLLLAFCTAFLVSQWQRLLVLLGGLLLLIPFLGSTASYAMSILIPTVMHVYIFTIIFMIFGALKAKSTLGHVNAALFFFGGIALVFLPQSGFQILPGYVEAHYDFFGSIAYAFADILVIPAETVLPAIASFLAFAYTYHYLNWFSKTSIIEWHQVTWLRAFIIGLLYAISVGLYLYDYGLGLIVLLSLSFLHVVLEFPLNFKSMEGVYKELRRG
jgi:hypothetical protein